MTNSADETAALRKLDLAHHLPPQQNFRLMEQLGGSRIITRGVGSRIYDADGAVLLDGMAGLWCMNVGYGREELARAAYDQMVELPFYNSFFRTTSAPTIRLAAKLAQLTGGDLAHFFFSNSGSEANDGALRLVRRYWDIVGQPSRKIFISRWNSYHGSTVAGASLGGMKHMHEQGGLPIPGIEHVMQPYSFADGFREPEELFAQRAANAIEERILAVGPQNVAAFIGEPVQGAGGVIIPPRGYWQRVETICRRHGILLISDEVICGFGRLGRWFGYQHFGFKPDIVTMAKGLSSGYVPISATAVSGPIVAALRDRNDDFAHGFTYSGHPTAAAVALKNIEIMEREGLVEKVASDLGPYLAKALARLAGHPLVGEVRSMGLLGAIEIVSRPGTNCRFGTKEGMAGAIVRDFCLGNGLMVRSVRDTIVMSPPFVITHAEIDELVDIIHRSLEQARDPLVRLTS